MPFKGIFSNSRKDGAVEKADPLKPVLNRTDHKCFGCGPVNPYGLKMTFFSDSRSVFSWVTVPDHLCGWDNLVHGGVISTMLDEVMSWAAISLLKKIILTKSITVDFLKPVHIGANLKLEGRVIRVEKNREAKMEAFLYNPKEEICAKSTGIFALLTPKLSKKLGIMDETALKDFEPLIDPL